MKVKSMFCVMMLSLLPLLLAGCSTGEELTEGATYTCEVAPVDAPEQVTTALVSQSMYRDVRDSYAVYFFKHHFQSFIGFPIV